MRNLKKTLCLVLALIFVLGLCTVGAADIEFKDESEIMYKEAVQTMAGLGILKGDDNDRDGKTEFRPKDGLTRAEAAKIIAYVALGPDVEYWPTTQVFDDVPSSHWAAKYISYCSNKKIINGVGNNKFDPNGKVTLVAVMKMLLSACGYNARDEFTGSGWELAVFDKGSEVKIYQGVKATDWYAGATREETAQLAYNTLMNVVQVTYENSTNSYVPVTVNGLSNVTLAETTWGIRTDEGVIIANKASSLTAKGTILSGTGRIMKYYVTEEDENAGKLGHKVRITYRLETVNGNEEAVAYFIEDKCTELKGAEAARYSDASTVYCFSSGQLMNSPIPARDVRATAPGTFVVNEDGQVIAYKTEGYFISVLTISPWTGQATVVDPTSNPANLTVEVQAPAGAVSGDLVTVYHMGDVYTTKLCSKQTYVQITAMDRNSVTNTITYNYGAIYPSSAAAFYLPLNITLLDGTYQQLQLRSTYTLYFDAEGGCIGFGDAAGSSAVLSSDTYGLFDAVRTDTDSWGEPAYYAQFILGNGSVKSVPISKAQYEAGLLNTVYKLTLVGTQYYLEPADATEMSYEAYTADPLTDYSGATFIQYSGTKGTLTATPTSKRPQANSAVLIYYTTERVGTVYVRKVKTVWFQTAASSVTPVDNNNYIFVASTTAKSSVMVGTNVVSYYDGYLNGAVMTDLITATPPTRVGFARGSKNSSGVYTLSYVGDGNGTATGVRTTTLTVDAGTDFESGIAGTTAGNTLYLRDSKGALQTLSLTGVTIVNVTGFAPSGMNISSVDQLVYILNSYNVTITLVEVVSGVNHTVGGSAIYVTGIYPRTAS